MPTGVEFANVIDVVAHDPATDEVALIMIETRPWDGSDPRIFQLQEKINAYLSFALDGEMAEEQPDLAGKPLRLQLDTVTPVDPRTMDFIAIVREQIGYQEIEFR